MYARISAATTATVATDNLLRRQQTAVLRHCQNRKRPKGADRFFWIMLAGIRSVLRASALKQAELLNMPRLQEFWPLVSFLGLHHDPETVRFALQMHDLQIGAEFG